MKTSCSSYKQLILMFYGDGWDLQSGWYIPGFASGLCHQFRPTSSNSACDRNLHIVYRASQASLGSMAVSITSP
jgi:hypothetical protein